jgi:hypothetical protein
MALIPRSLRPSVLIRRKAMHAGFLGPSRVWKVIGVVVFGRSTLTKIFGKSEEVVDVSSLGPERFMTLTTAKPVTRKRRRKLRKQGIEPLTLKQHQALGRLWAAEADAAKRAS